MTNLNYYKILRLRSCATPREIGNAYRDLSVLYGDGKESAAKEIMRLIEEAHLVLQDPRDRASYDLEKSIKRSENLDQIEFSEAERIINTWGPTFTSNEREYIDKIHTVNKAVRIAIFIVGIVFVWSVISFRWNISFILIFGVWLLRNMIWSIYRIKNPPPPPEVWGVE